MISLDKKDSGGGPEDCCACDKPIKLGDYFIAGMSCDEGQQLALCFDCAITAARKTLHACQLSFKLERKP
jgi:hypothetical protein